jgi:hypothetical protein
MYSTGSIARDILRTSPQNIHQAIYRGKIQAPIHRFGHCYVWTAAEIERLADVLGKRPEWEAFKRLPVGTVDPAKLKELNSVTIEEALRDA